MHPELEIADAAPNFIFQRQMPFLALAELTGKYIEAILALIFGVIHRNVGIFYQRICCRPIIRIGGNTDTRGNIQFVRANNKWLLDGLDDFFRYSVRY